MIKRVLLIMVGLLLTAGMALRMPIASAQNAVMVSNDGRNWTPSLADPIFDQSNEWVPGDSQQGTFWVRNDGGDPADLTITATTSRNRLINSDAFQLSARAGDGSWADLPLDTPLDLADLMQPGRPLQIFVRAAFLFSSGNQSQDELARLDFLVTLTESVAGPPTSPGNPANPSNPANPGNPSNPGNPGNPTTQGGRGSLPNTGAVFPAWLVPVAAIASGTGAALLMRRRRSKGERR